MESSHWNLLLSSSGGAEIPNPLVFWGEPQSEITAYYDYLNDEIEYEDDKKFNMIRTLALLLRICTV